MLNGLSVVRIVIILFPVVSIIRPPDPTPLLQHHYSAFIAPTGRSAPVLCIGTLASRFSPLVLPVYARGTVIFFGQRIRLAQRFHFADVNVQTPETPGRFSLPLDV